MKKVLLLSAFKIFSKQNPKYIRKSIFFSILIVAISFSSLVLINSISQSFKLMLFEKLYTFTGHIKMNNANGYEFYGNDHLARIKEIDGVLTVNEYSETYAMARSYKGLSEGVLVVGVQGSIEDKIHKYLANVNKSSSLDENEAIIGRSLADIFDIGVGDSLILFNIENAISGNKIIAKNIQIKNVFDSGIIEYDRNVIFINYSTSIHLFSSNKFDSGFLVQLKSPLNVDDFEIANTLDLNDLGVNSISWKDKHYDIINWANFFDKPIYIIMLFILLFSILNMSFSSFFLFKSRIRQIVVLEALGYSIFNRIYIYIYELICISGLALILGNIISIFFIWVQKTLNIIKLDSNIYFTDSLPIMYNFKFNFILSIVVLLITILFGFIYAFKIKDLSIRNIGAND